jgi:acetyl esterase/lipase
MAMTKPITYRSNIHIKILLKSTLILFLCLTSFPSFSQDFTIPLWPNEVPNQEKTNEVEKKEQKDILLISNVQNPTIEVYLPPERSATGEAVLIFPGGGYYVLAYDWEGIEVAKWLNSNGIAAFVVKYRLPVSKSIIEPYKAPLQDAQRAMRLVRAHAKEWRIDQSKVGIMGFSAGGHLASTLGTHFDEKIYDAQDSVDSQSARPDFMALIYPVISFESSSAHQGSKFALLGDKPDEKLVKHFSNELQVSDKTPPTFLLHASDDTGVPAENSLLFYTALIAKKISAEMHIFPTGGHGFALGTKQPEVSQWKELFISWVKNQ